MKKLQTKEKTSWEIEHLIDELPRHTFKNYEGHEFIDTCKIYLALQKYRRECNK